MANPGQRARPAAALATDQRPILARYKVKGSRSAGRKLAIFYCTQLWEARRLKELMDAAGWRNVAATDEATGLLISTDDVVVQY